MNIYSHILRGINNKQTQIHYLSIYTSRCQLVLAIIKVGNSISIHMTQLK